MSKIGNTLLDAIVGKFIGYRISTLADAMTESVKDANKGYMYLTPNGIVMNGALVAEPNQVLKLRLNGSTEDTVIGEYIGANGATGSGAAFDIKTGTTIGSIAFEGTDVKINGSDNLSKITGDIVTDIQFVVSNNQLQYKHAGSDDWKVVPNWPTMEQIIRSGFNGGSVALSHNTTDDTVKTVISTSTGTLIESNTLTINNVAHATKATQDSEGNVINSTYATKAEVDALLETTNALVLAGTIGATGNIDNWNDKVLGTKPSSPADISISSLNNYVALSAGWTFVFGASGTILDTPIEAGDTLIITRDASLGSINILTSDYYIIVNTNIDIATTGTAGTIKIAGDKRGGSITTSQGGTITSRYYGLEIDATNKAFVNVPWVKATHTVGKGLSVSDTTTNENQTVNTDLNVVLKTTQSNNTANISLNDKTDDTEIAKVDLPLAQNVDNAGLMTRAQSDKLTNLPGVVGATNSAGTATSFKVASVTMDGASKQAVNMKLAYTPNSSTGANLYIQDANNGNANVADIAIPKATTENYGPTKLASSVGQNEDVVMTQKAVSDIFTALENALKWQ